MSKIKKIIKKNPQSKQASPKIIIPTSNHRYDEEISDIAFKVLVHGYITSIEQSVSAEREMRRELKRRVFNKDISQIAFSYYKKVIELSDRQPLNKVVIKILEVRWDEYRLVKKHMDNLSEISFINRFDNLLNKMNKLNWKIEFVEKGSKNTFDGSINYILVDKDYKNKFFNKEGGVIKSFYIGVRSIQNINVMIETAYICGFITKKEEVKGHLYGITIYPENNVPGIPFPPPSVTKISLRDH